MKSTLGVIVSALMIAGFLFLCWNRKPGYITKTVEFRKEMIAKADLAAIRNWLQKEVTKEKYNSQQKHWCSISREDCPTSILDLHPVYVEVRVSPASVCLTRGGGFGHWGIVIFLNEYNEEFLLHEEGQYIDEYRLTIDSNAYVWHEIQH